VRRAQLLSTDALISLLLVIMIIGAVSSTSENLRNGIASLVGWYGRSNAANNMLDVLLKTPGVPENWSENVSLVRVPGLRLSNGPHLDYSKVRALIEGVRSKNPSLLSALWNLSNHHNFELAFSLPNQSVYLRYSYNVSEPAGRQLAICNVGQLGNSSDSPVVINASSCSNEEFEFTHSGVAYDSYTNPYYVCIYGNALIGNDFTVSLGQYLAVNGSLKVDSDGWLSSSGLYVTGDVSVGNGGYVENVSGDAYVGGDLTVGSSGHVNVASNLYVYGSTTVQSTGYLTVGGSMYSLKGLNVTGNGNVRVGDDLYVGSSASLGTGANVSSGGDVYINGSLVEDSGTYLVVGGSAVINGSLTTDSVTNTFGGLTFINGDLTVGLSSKMSFGGDVFVNGGAIFDWSSQATVNGTLTVNGPMQVSGAILNVSGGLYVNGSLEETPSVSTRVMVNGPSFINGNMTVEGTNVFRSNLTVNGDLLVDWGSELVVYGDLYVSGEITVNGRLVVYGNVYEYSPREPPMTIKSGGGLSVGSWVYVNGTDIYGTRTWYAFYGTGISVYSYDFTGYKYIPGGGGFWRQMDVGVIEEGGSYYISIGYWLFFFFISERNLAEVDYTFDIKINGTGNLNLPPDAGSVFSYNATVPQIVSPVPPAPPFYYPPCTVSQSGSTSVEINVESLNVSYEFPTNATITVISIVNGSLVTNLDTVEKSKYAAPWVQYAEARVPVSVLIYGENYTIPRNETPMKLYEGLLTQGFVGDLMIELPSENGNLTMLSTFSRGNHFGYSLLVVVKNESETVYGVRMEIPQLNYSGVPSGCRIKVTNNGLMVPVKCFVPEPRPGEGVTFSMWLYSTSFSNVSVVDLSNLGLVMRPVYRVATVKLWVWGG